MCISLLQFSCWSMTTIYISQGKSWSPLMLQTKNSGITTFTKSSVSRQTVEFNLSEEKNSLLRKDKSAKKIGKPSKKKKTQLKVFCLKSKHQMNNPNRKKNSKMQNHRLLRCQQEQTWLLMRHRSLRSNKLSNHEHLADQQVNFYESENLV